MSLRLFVGGTRGSRPVTGAAFTEFGGDTTSLLLAGSGGERLVLDAGTGMHAIAGQLAHAGPGEVTVLLSHYHLDHVAGLTMNPLFCQPGWSFKLVGPTFTDGNVREVVTRLLSPPYWPLPVERMSARIEFAEFPSGGMQVGQLCVRGCPVPHPGGCMAYRIDDMNAGASLVFATDIEWQSRTRECETTFMTMCREPGPADMLAMDAHFAGADAKAFAGWGHSTWEDCLEIAETVGVKRVLLGHHDPNADDQALRIREQRVKRRSPSSIVARAGQWLTIG